MPTTLTAHEQPISRIFSNDYVFKIPSYQRPYAWKTDQARDLFDDLIGYMKARPAEVEDVPPYFLGSIVLIKAPELQNADVVDGQQRLTTLTLLLSAIRANVGPDNAADITQLLYEKGSQILGTQDRFRLSLRLRDQEFFQRYVQLEGGFGELLKLNEVQSDSLRNLRDNGRLFNDRLAAIAGAERIKLAQFIVTRCYLVAVATPDLDFAYRIFSVLNSRGLDLSATDILKAEIIGGVPTMKRDEYTKKWEECEEDLGRDAFGDLFSHIRMVYRKAKPQGTLLKEFKEHVTKDIVPLKFIDNVLIPMANAYEEITDSAYSSPIHAEAINVSLKWLNRLEFNDWLPPALAFAVRKRNVPEDMERFFRDLERLAYAMLITKWGVNDRIDRFSRLTRAIEGGDDNWIGKSVLQLSEQEQFNVYQALNGEVYESLSARARSTLLLRLDALMSGGGASYDYETITVEHVLPQNPPTDSQWIEWFPDVVNRTSLVHKLGNLALLTRKKNSAASNYDFERKKTTYFARGGVSPFVLTTQVLRHNEWTREIVESRQQELLTRLENHWRLHNRKDLREQLLDEEAVIVAPSEEPEIITEKGDLKARHVERRKFWDGLLDVARGKTDLHANRTATKFGWIAAGSGARGITFNYVILQHQARVEVWIARGIGKATENKDIFARLFEKKDEIERAFGEPLDWQCLDDKDACRVQVTSDVGGYRDPDKWPRVYEWMTNRMVALDQAFRPNINALHI